MKREYKNFEFRSGEHDIFRTIHAGRENVLFNIIRDILFGVSSYPAYIAEIFMRRKFGERNFSTLPAIIIAMFMLWLWYFSQYFGLFELGFMWLPFLMAIIAQAIRHRLKIKKFGTHYNFDWYSYSDGLSHPVLEDLIGKTLWGFKINQQRFYTLIEPGIPIGIGLILSLLPFTRGVGLLIAISGLCFGYRNFMKTCYARALVLDEIDKMICMDAKYDVLVEEESKEQTHGISVPINLPEDRAMREILNKSLEDPKSLWDYDRAEDEEKDDEDEEGLMATPINS
ncbi:MAG: hypothetical protein CML04_01980 [Pseudozobellia sp.]|nr:hypothetical protein [Pseudozobellia sp.]MBG48951.1 hypothetical protein [Pseudozobellia sp.]|tara:strand:+ start:637 stop:1488 length:852 start_codon:yes stop_codon:yes gene_type:complete